MRLVSGSDILRDLILCESVTAPLYEKVYWDKDKKTKVSYTDDFIDGHCHDFAVALHRMFGYKLGLIKGSSEGEGGKVKHLFHAFGIDKKKQAFDVNGKYDVKRAIDGFSNSFHPDHISFDVYDSEARMAKKLWTIKTDEKWIRKGFKRVASDAGKYFDDRRLKKISSVEFPKKLIIDPAWNPYGGKFEKGFEKKAEKIVSLGMNQRYKGWHFSEPRLDYRMEYGSDGMMDLKRSGGYGDMNVEISYNDHFISTGGNLIRFNIQYEKMSDQVSVSNMSQFFKDLAVYANKVTPAIMKNILGE